MKMLRIKTQIHKYDDVKAFFDEFNIGGGDLIFTHEFIYDPIISPNGKDADILYFEKFGQGEPTNIIIDKIFDQIKDKDYKRVIAIGGGSVIDIGKLMVFDMNCKATDIFENKIPLVKKRELIILPTTCGTGSEVTNIAVAEIVERKTKMGLMLDDIYADHAVLIAKLVKSLPYKFFLFSSVDALIHAVESYVSPKSNEYTELFSVASIKIIISGYKAIFNIGEKARFDLMENFLVASNYAGIAFDNTGVGAVHALSYPFGRYGHVPHGGICYHFFIEVFKAYDSKKPVGKIKEVKQIISKILRVDEVTAFHELGKLIDTLIERKALREYGMAESEIEGFASNVVENQKRLLDNNYVALSRNEICNIYRKLL